MANGLTKQEQSTSRTIKHERYFNNYLYIHRLVGHYLVWNNNNNQPHCSCCNGVALSWQNTIPHCNGKRHKVKVEKIRKKEEKAQCTLKTQKETEAAEPDLQNQN
eukprot:7268310-Ditylum_brightwellii.AAC.1